MRFHLQSFFTDSTIQPRSSGILGEFDSMLWLMIGLLVSLAALLFAAAGLARHIWLQRRKLRLDTQAALDASQEAELEREP